MFMNRVHTVTQKHSRVKNPGQKPNWLHEPPTGPASTPGHAQAARPARPRPAPRAPKPSAPHAHGCRARLLVRTPRAPCACCLPPAACRLPRAFAALREPPAPRRSRPPAALAHHARTPSARPPSAQRPMRARLLRPARSPAPCPAPAPLVTIQFACIAIQASSAFPAAQSQYTWVYCDTVIEPIQSQYNLCSSHLNFFAQKKIFVFHYKLIFFFSFISRNWKTIKITKNSSFFFFFTL